MHQIFISWVIWAVVLVGLAWVLGRFCTESHRGLGILIDSRRRMSLTHFQLVVWSLRILSLISGVFFRAVVGRRGRPARVHIPVAADVRGIWTWYHRPNPTSWARRTSSTRTGRRSCPRTASR